MNPLGTLEYAFHKLRRVPRWAWVSAVLGLLLVPLLLIWLALSLLGSAFQGGHSLVTQGRELLNAALPDVKAQLDATLPEAKAMVDGAIPAVQARISTEITEVRSLLETAIPPMDGDLLAVATGVAGTQAAALLKEGTGSFDQALLTALGTALPAADVGGEDPHDVPRFPGFFRTQFERNNGGMSVSYAGKAAHAEVLTFYRNALAQAGYSARVMSASADSEVIEFLSPERKLVLTATSDGRGHMQLSWVARG